MGSPPPLWYMYVIMNSGSLTVSLFVHNQHGFLHSASGAPAAAVSSLLQQETSRISAHIEQQKGIVDLLSADHVFGSCGAVRPCGAHRQAAVRAVMRCVEGVGGEEKCEVDDDGLVGVLKQLDSSHC